MSAAEFVSWRGYLRQSPVGWQWLNKRLAELMREVSKLRPNLKQWEDLEHFLWKPPEALFVTRKKAEGKARRAQRDRSKRL